MPQHDAAAKLEQILTEAGALIRRRLEESGLVVMRMAPSRADVAAELLRLASLVENSRGDTAVSASVHF